MTSPNRKSNCPNGPSTNCSPTNASLLGFYVTGHPLTPFVPILEKYALHTTAQLAALANHTMTRIGGLVTEAQKGISKKSGKPYRHGHARRFGRLRPNPLPQ